MYWSAAMTLKTPQAKDKTPNYGSFTGTPRALSAASRTGSGGNIRIPQSIPEHQCLLQFASPRLHQYEEEKLAEYHEMEQAQSYADAAKTTVTVKASKTLHMLLLSSGKLEQFSSNSSTSSTASTASDSSHSSHSSDYSYMDIRDADNHYNNNSSNNSSNDIQQHNINSNSNALFSYLNEEIAAARAAGEDSDQLNYWMLERERLRAKRERRHLLHKNAVLSGTKVVHDDEPASAWRTGAIMCSVPLLLVILFAIFVLASGQSGGSVVAPSAWEMIVSSVTGKASSEDNSAEIAARAALRGSS